MYAYLKTRDRTWLNERMKIVPIAKRSNYRRQIGRDPEAALLVPKALAALQMQPGHPIRVCPNSLAKHLSEREGRLLLRCKRFPQTKAALDQVAQTPEAFLDRCIAWGLQYCRDERVTLTLRQFCGIAGLQEACRKPGIQAKIEAALKPYYQALVRNRRFAFENESVT